MAALVTWQQVGPPTKTGDGVAPFYTDLNTMFTSKASDVNFLWEVASYNDAATPYYLVLKRKDASVGRLLFVTWTSTPAGANSTLCVSGNPSNNLFYCTWFPNGNTDTPSNLTSASGTVMGNDTDALYMAHGLPAAAYNSTYSIQAFAHAGGVMVLMGQTGTTYVMGGGQVVVDQADVAYDCCFSSGNGNVSDFWDGFPFNSSSETTDATWGMIRANYGANNRMFFHPWSFSGNWHTDTNLQDTTNVMYDWNQSKLWWSAFPLMANIKGANWTLKWRQMAYGPVQRQYGSLPTVTNLNHYIYSSSDTVPDIIVPIMTAGNTNPSVYLTNFKV